MKNDFFTASTIVDLEEEELLKAAELSDEEVEKMAACDCEVIPELYF
jgi:hypothetical protein